MKEEKVIVYSTPVCMYCNMLKDWFDEKGVKYESIDVSQDPEKARFIAEKTGQLGVPVTQIGEGDFVLGFDQVKLTEILKLD
ncbi:NrdH-redoxin [Candidatus Campbellbacteria bacterium]|nr:MAG: NrdH-redoxin [Candidatus Campbellbacteria bacterium]